MQKVATLTIIMLSFMCFISVSMPHFTAASDNGTDISMNVSPEGPLFAIDNMKPGDWAPRTVTIENNGKRDFNYVVEMDQNGSDKLFQKFIMELEIDGKEIYNGKVSHFTDLTERALKVDQTEELEFTIRFPEHLGNAYQGLNINFSIIFTAIDQEDEDVPPVTPDQKTRTGKTPTNADAKTSLEVDGTIGSDDETTLPETTTNIFNYLMTGGVLAIIGIILAAYNRKRKKT